LVTIDIDVIIFENYFRMPNKYQLPTIVAILAIGIVSLSVLQLNQVSNEKMKTSDSPSLEIIQKSNTLASSVSNTKIKNIPNSAEFNTSIPNDESSSKETNLDCVIPTELIKFKSDSGCYTFQVAIPYDTDDTYPLRSPELVEYSKIVLSKDFYNRIKNSTKSPTISIITRSANKVSENIYNVRLGFFDVEYLKTQNIRGTDADTFEIEYIVNLSGQKSFEMSKFSDLTKK
jgi:hypothetical protein